MSVAAIVLAAGRGRRMGGAKHLLPVGGTPMLEHVVCALLESRAASVTVVLRPEDAEGEALVAALGVPSVPAESPDEGRAASVRAGVRACPDADAWLFALADQPFLSSQDFDRLIDAGPGADGIAHAVYAGDRGSPVLFGATYRAELLALTGREGGRQILLRHPDRAIAVPLDSERGRDLDRPEDLGYPASPMERTFSIIKPDAVSQGNAFKVLDRIEASGLQIVATRMLHMTQAQAEGFYAVHRERPFFGSLVEFMTSGPVIVSVLEGDGAIARYRDLMGATNPDEAAEGTIRKEFATNIERNAVHGSDSPETALEEIAYFFRTTELVSRK